MSLAMLHVDFADQYGRISLLSKAQTSRTVNHFTLTNKIKRLKLIIHSTPRSLLVHVCCACLISESDIGHPSAAVVVASPSGCFHHFCVTRRISRMKKVQHRNFNLGRYVCCKVLYAMLQSFARDGGKLISEQSLYVI
jgi:hypothetical protein